jgi:hypothetical protein
MEKGFAHEEKRTNHSSAMAFDLVWAAKVHPLALRVVREGSKK